MVFLAVPQYANSACVDDCLRSWGASGDVNVNWDYLVGSFMNVVALLEYSTREGA